MDFDAWMMLRFIASQSREEKQRIRDFILVLGLCHSALSKKETLIKEFVPSNKANKEKKEEEAPNDYQPKTEELQKQQSGLDPYAAAEESHKAKSKLTNQRLLEDNNNEENKI